MFWVCPKVSYHLDIFRITLTGRQLCPNTVLLLASHHVPNAKPRLPTKETNVIPFIFGLLFQSWQSVINRSSWPHVRSDNPTGKWRALPSVSPYLYFPQNYLKAHHLLYIARLTSFYLFQMFWGVPHIRCWHIFFFFLSPSLASGNVSGLDY